MPCWHSKHLLHWSTLQFTTAVASTFVAMCVLSSFMSSELCGQDFVCAHVQLSRIYSWCHAHDKMYQALPLISRNSLGTRLPGYNGMQHCESAAPFSFWTDKTGVILMCLSRWPRVSWKQSQDNKIYHATEHSAINRGFAFTLLDYIIQVVHAILEGKCSFHWDFNTSASNLPLLQRSTCNLSFMNE